MEQPVIVRSDSDNERAAILFLVKSGMHPAEIAAVTGMTEERIGTAINILCKELGVTSRVELLLLIYSVADVPTSEAARNRAEYKESKKAG